MFVIAVPVLAYVIKIGGDARHYRYLAFPFVMMVCSLGGLSDAFIHKIKPDKRIIWVLGILLTILVFLFHPYQYGGHPILDNSWYFKWEHRSGISDGDGSRTSVWRRDVARSDDVIRMSNELKNLPFFKYRGSDSSDLCSVHYNQINMRAVHSYGLTESILARTVMKSDRPAHKVGLRHMADDIMVVQKMSGGAHRGMYRRAYEEGWAPVWIGENLKKIELLEKRIYNQHDFIENLLLAFSTIEPFKVSKAGCWGCGVPDDPIFDINSCDNILDQWDKDWCYYYQVQKSGDLFTCQNKIVDKNIRDYCYSIIAVTENKFNMCDMVQDGRVACMVNLAAMNKDIRLCNGIKLGSRDLCIMAVARRLKKPLLCRKINDRVIKGLCRRDIASITGDVNTCKRIGKTYLKDSCRERAKVASLK